jgi:hypothetical protein
MVEFDIRNHFMVIGDFKEQVDVVDSKPCD